MTSAKPKQKRGRRETPMPAHPVDPWPPAKLQRLRELWLSGMGPTEIGRQPDIRNTRCAVIGKAHRLGLSARPKEKPKQTTPEGYKLNCAPERQQAGVNPLPAGHPLAMQILTGATWPRPDIHSRA